MPVKTDGRPSLKKPCPHTRSWSLDPSDLRHAAGLVLFSSPTELTKEGQNLGPPRPVDSTVSPF